MPYPHHLRTIALALLLGAAAHAQPLPRAAEEALALGRSLAAEALATYPTHFPDRPLWRDALDAGASAVALAPGRLEPLRFLAEAYGTVGWVGPAWSTWREYLALGGPIDADVRGMLTQVGHEIAYAAYQRGDLPAALALFEELAGLVPDDVDALVWSGRILMESGQPRAAVPYWRAVTEIDPGDARAAYFLRLAEDQVRWGIDAANTFREGVARYEAGEMQAASERFARATRLEPSYAAAFAWLGRIAFERGDYRAAQVAYGSAVALEPGNETYRYFAEESARRLAPAGN